MVALFRATHDLWAGDPAFATCSTASARAAPNSRPGGTRTTSAGGAGQKVLYRMRGGKPAFEYATFQANDE